MAFKGISANDAHYLLSRWQAGEEEALDAYEVALDNVDSAASEKTGHAIRDVKDLYEQSRDSNDRAGFDREAAVAFHSAIAPLPPSIEGDPGFWRWVALQMFHVIEWRHSRPDGAHPHNYGLGSRTSNYPRRLWFRAALSYDEAADPYELVRRGPVDFWESGIIRPRYSSCRALVRAFVRWQYPEPSSMGSLHLTHADGIRLLYKQLKRLHSTMALELLDDNEAYSLLDDLGSDLRRA